MNLKWYFNRRLCTAQVNLGKFSIESVVKMAVLRSKRRQEGSKQKLPLTQAKFARLLVVSEVQQPLALPVTRQHFHPSVI